MSDHPGRGAPARFDASPPGRDDRDVDDRIIDLAEYARRKEEDAEEPVRTTFALHGGEGERARFALPLWRATYLAGGTRAGLVWEPVGNVDADLEAFVVLDLGSEPPRTDFPGTLAAELRSDESAPGLVLTEEAVVVFLGESRGRRWYLVVHPREGDAVEGSAMPREDLYFLAGECAGLLFHRELDRGAEGG